MYSRLFLTSILVSFLSTTSFSAALTKANSLIVADTIFLTDSNMSSAACEGLIIDDGGLNGNYSNDQNTSVSIAAPAAQAYELNLISFNTEDCCDQMLIRGYTGGEEVFFESFRFLTTA